jgi:hypothetical protein
MEHHVEIVTGKQGRTNANKPSHELLAVLRTLDMDSGYLGDSELESIVDKVRGILQTHRGHRFDPQYMNAHDGAYGIRVIALDKEYNVHAYTMPVYRPTSHGGHVVFRTGKEIEKVLKITHSDVPIEEAGGMELGLFVSKFKDIDCLFIVPDTIDDPVLFRALDLEVKGDGTDTTTLVYLRLCDKLGLGRSPPHLSIGKFKFLFPGVALDTSLIKSKGTKRSREPTPPPPPPPSTVENTWDIMSSLLSDSIKHARTYDRESEIYKAKGFLYLLAQNFLEVFDIRVGRARFNTIFKDYVHLPVNIFLETMGNRSIIQSIIDTNIRDIQSREIMTYHVDSYMEMIGMT